MSLTVFANFYINDIKRLERMKTSFLSFCEGSIDFWLINIRGEFSNEAEQFLLKYIPKKNISVTFLNSEHGWFYDSRKIINKIQTKYVFIWNEDHKNLRSINEFNSIINEIIKHKIENFSYSFFHEGDLYKSLLIEESNHSKNIIYLDNTIKVHKKRMRYLKNNKILGQRFLISLVAIYSTEMFKKIILSNDPPLKRWPISTPFNFEKTEKDIHWLPFRFAVPKNEFFKCIDKDTMQGSYEYFNSSKKKFSIKSIINRSKIFFREIINKFVSRYILNLKD